MFWEGFEEWVSEMTRKRVLVCCVGGDGVVDMLMFELWSFGALEFG